MIIRNLVLNARQLNMSTVSALIGTRIPEEIVVSFSHTAMKTLTGTHFRTSVGLCDCCTIEMLARFAICCADYTCVGTTQRQHR